MTQQIINVGELPNDGSGDPLRLAFQKINDNFTQVFTAPGAAGTDGSFQYRSLNSLTAAAYYDTLWVLGGITQWWTSVDAVTCEPLTTYTPTSAVKQIYAAATGFIAVGADSMLLTSGDGLIWTARSPADPSNFNGVAQYDGGRYVIVGDAGAIQTSLDAITWTSVVSGTSQHLNSVAVSSIGWVAVGDNGTIVFSSNGTTWVLVTPTGTSENLNSVVYDGSYYVAVGDGGTILRSADGTVWVPIVTTITENLTSVTTGVFDGDTIDVAVGDSGAIYTSTDFSTTWEQPLGYTRVASNLTSVCRYNNLFLAVGLNGTVLTSPDAVDWSNVTIAGVMVGSTQLTYNDLTEQLTVDSTTISITGNTDINTDSTKSLNIGYTDVSNVNVRSSTTINGRLRLPVYNANPNTAHSVGGDIFYNANTGFLEWFDSVSGLWKVVSDGNPDPSNTLINGNAVFTLESSGNTSVPGSMIPTVANSYDLGSVDSPWRSLYVSNNTIYIDSVPLSVSGNTLTVAGIPVITSDTTDPVITSNTVTSAGLVLTTNTGIQFSDNTVLTSTDSIGTVKSVDISGGNTGLTTADGPITSTGTITLEGTLNIEHGGTGQTTAQLAFDALAPTTNTGDIIYNDGSNNTRLPIGEDDQVLKVVGGVPSWANNQTANTGDVTFSTNVVQGTGYELGLSPGTGFTDDYQYFRVRGGDVPEHLHFDTTNSNAYDLYVGDDQKFFKLSKDGPAIIQSLDANTATGYTWTFGIDGKLTLPVDGDIVNSNGSSVLSVGTVTSIDISGGDTGLLTVGGPITSNGTITIGGTLNVANGGTGATTVAAAFTALAPSQANNAGKLLTTNGTTASWSSLGITNEIYVSKGGNDSTADGSITKPFLTISAAINYLNTNYPVANNSGTQFVIVVGPGLYSENVNINRLLTHLWAYEGKLKTTRISGTVTVTSAVDYQGIFQNVVSLNNLFIDNTTNNALEVTGSIPISIDINNCALYTDSTGVPFVMTNTALGGNRLRLIGTDLTAAGNASALDITNVTNCFINDINTSSAKVGGSAWKIADSVMTIGTVQLVGSGTNGPANLLEVTGATSIVSVGYSSFTSGTTNGNGIYIGAGARVIAGANFYNIPLGTGYSVTGAAGGIYVRGGNQAVPGTNNGVNPLLSLSTFNMNTHIAASDIVGAVAIANGGTGQTSKTAAFDALAPTTTAGDLIYYNGTDNVRLPAGSNNQVLSLNGTTPTWVNGVRKTTGSWTVTPGSSTYSFSVPDNNTYTMWVRGNIPNGIIVWNATVSLSNANVPAIGTQYGWYYLAGNQLVLTSMPDQIIGTAGSISTATVATTTANTFTFGITNNSGSNCTIEYGYITL
jgi:hypothetical protein